VNARDERIDEGPVDIVSDARKVSGSPAVVNGLSCMSCHAQGMLAFSDQVRGGHILGGNARDLVRRLFPPQNDLDRVVERDRKRFLDALDAACGPFLKLGANTKTSIQNFKEPVAAIARWYLSNELRLEEASRELGLDDPQILRGAIELNPRLQELGLLPLARGNTVKREVWEDVSQLVSPFQAAARELKLGVPIVF